MWENNLQQWFDIDWEKLLDSEWLWLLSEEIWDTWTDCTYENAKKACNGTCIDCINTFIWETQTRINTLLCCKQHPETWEISEEWCCPEINPETWLCNIYQTDEYPAICSSYHCKRDWF